MKFYLGQKDTEHEVKVEVAPKITETLDETLDGATCVLEANQIQNPIAPMTSFYIELNENETILMYVVGDNVEVFSHRPLRYKHTLSLSQNIHKLTKHVVKNSVFSQPPQKIRKSWWSYTQVLQAPLNGSSSSVMSPMDALYGSSKQGECEVGITLESREKIKGTPYILITYQCATHEPDDDNHSYEYFENLDLTTFTNKCTGVPTKITWEHEHDNPRYYIVAYVYYDGGYDVIRLSDIEGQKIVFNKPMYVPKLKEILENHTNVYVSTYKKTKTMTGLDDWYGYANPFCTNGDAIVNQFHTYPEDGVVPAFIMTQIQIVCETYYHSCYDILNLLDLRQKQLHYFGGQLRGKQSLFKLDPNSETGKLLKNTISPNFTFTQCTMFECVAEVFKLFDAIFTIDENGYLVIDYLNNVQDETQRVYETDFSGETRTLTTDKYNNGLISYYQDARTTEVFPGKNGFIRATSKAFGVPQQQDHVILTPHKIDNIEKAVVRIFQFEVPIYYPTVRAFSVNGYMNLDITPYVVEQSVWGSLSKSNGIPINNDYKQVGQVNSVFYEKGNNTIELGYSYSGAFGIQFSAFYNALVSALMRYSGANISWRTGQNQFQIGTPSSQDWRNTYLHIEYETSVDGRVKSESIVNKYNGEMIIDQYNGSVDLAKMGLNMEGLSMKMGEPTLNMTHKITSWSQRLRKGSVYIDNDGKKWVANICSYTILDNDNIQGQISFTANYNALSMRTKLNRERRMTNISPELVQKSEDNFIEYIYYSTRDFLSNETSQGTAFSNNIGYLANSFFITKEDNIPYFVPDCAIHIATNITTDARSTYIPLIRYASGNSICFEMSYDDPIKAGQRTTVSDGPWGTNQYFTEYKPYPFDNTGFNDCVRLYLCDSNTVDLTDFPNAGVMYGYAPIFALEYLYVYKQPNEIFALNYQICFLPLEDRKDIDFLGQAFFKYNFLINNDNGIRNFYIRYGFGQYNILDTEPIGTDTYRYKVINDSSSESYSGKATIRLLHTGHRTPEDATCWCLEDDDGNIYFMSNNVRQGTLQIIYLLARHDRL